MNSIKSAEQVALSSSDDDTKEGSAKVVTRNILVRTDERSEFINITPQVQSFVNSAQISDGHLQVLSLHTTTGLFINEWQDALLSDIMSLLQQLVPSSDYYRHNDPQFSDCDRKNAHSHLINTLLGHSLSIPIIGGELMLGQWQNIIFAEFDGPNQRRIFLQALGI
jgi:secondary thiamine-phosphate synthase enzyme